MEFRADGNCLISPFVWLRIVVVVLGGDVEGCL